MKKITDIKIKSNMILEEFSDNIADLEKTEITKSEPSKFLSEIFKSKIISENILFNNTKYGSYEIPVLEDYIRETSELIDLLMMVYAGQYETIENFEIIDNPENNETDIIQYLIGLAEFIKSTRYTAFLKEDTHLHGIIDIIVSLVYRTIFKLKH